MNDVWWILIGLSVPFIGTALGAAMAFILRKDMSPNIQKTLLGFAAGVMMAASVWSLLIPAMEMSDGGQMSWMPAVIGFSTGVGFLLALDTIIPHLHLNSEKPEGINSQRYKRSTMLTFAVTLHNIPEGMAIGVVFAGVLAGDPMISMAGALALAVGIAIQNFPEGAIVSMPLVSNGLSKRRAFAYGTLSGVVEPIGAIAVMLLASVFVPMLPYLLAFAAGAMIYVVIEELIPESQAGEHSNVATIGFAIGFVMMMILDVALG